MLWAGQREVGIYIQCSDKMALIRDLKEVKKRFFEIYRFKHSENAANELLYLNDLILVNLKTFVYLM